MAAKLDQLKADIGFTKDSPCCKNCKNLIFDIVEQTAYNGVKYKENKNIRCDFSERVKFKVGISNYCNNWIRKQTE